MNVRRLLTWFLPVVSVFGVECLQADIVTTCPFKGVTLITRTEMVPRPVMMHIVTIDLNAPGIGFRLTPQSGPQDTLIQTTLDFLNELGAQVAINTHFYLLFGSNEANVVGLAVSEGVAYSSFEPQPVQPTFVDQSYAIIPYGVALNIDPSNRAAIVHRDPAYPDNQHVQEPVTLWTALSGSAQIVSNGVTTIPTYSGPPDGLNAVYGYSSSNSWYSYLHARTAIGLSRENEKLILFTVDETGGSYGMTPGEVADVLVQDYHVYNALNLDGDGSTTLVVQDPATKVGHIVNADTNFIARATGCNLAVFAQPNSEPAMVLTVTTSTNGVTISWPVSAGGWQLQENPGLCPTNWVNVSAIPQCTGERMAISVVPDAVSHFYRLIK
jgi:hypothetical protein